MAISSAAAPCRPAALAPNFRICFWAEATALAKRANSSATCSSAMVYSGTLTAPDSTRWANPTAMPEETPTPSKACSLIERRRLRSVFIELAPDQIEHRNGEVGRRAAEHVGQQDDAVALINRGDAIENIAPALLHVVFGADTDGGDFLLRAHDMFECSDEFHRQSTLGDENQSKHVNVLRLLFRRRRRARCRG